MLKEIFMHTYKTAILFSVSLLLVRVMGKRTIAQLSPFDLIVIIIMGSAIAIPLEDDKIKLSYGITPVIILSILNYILAILITKSKKIEDFFQGKPTVLVKNGEIMVKNLKKERITITDLLVLLREKNVTNINDIEEATIEPNGKMSILKRRQMQSVTPKDLGLWTTEGIFPTLVVDQGNVAVDNLDKVGVAIDQMLKELNKKGIQDLAEIKSAWVDEEGNVLVDKVQ